MSGECYILAHISGLYIVRASKPYTTKQGDIKAYTNRVDKEPNLKILKA